MAAPRPVYGPNNGLPISAAAASHLACTCPHPTVTVGSRVLGAMPTVTISGSATPTPQHAEGGPSEVAALNEVILQQQRMMMQLVMQQQWYQQQQTGAGTSGSAGAQQAGSTHSRRSPTGQHADYSDASGFHAMGGRKGSYHNGGGRGASSRADSSEPHHGHGAMARHGNANVRGAQQTGAGGANTHHRDAASATANLRSPAVFNPAAAGISLEDMRAEFELVREREVTHVSQQAQRATAKAEGVSQPATDAAETDVPSAATAEEAASERSPLLEFACSQRGKLVLQGLIYYEEDVRLTRTLLYAFGGAFEALALDEHGCHVLRALVEKIPVAAGLDAADYAGEVLVAAATAGELAFAPATREWQAEMERLQVDRCALAIDEDLSFILSNITETLFLNMCTLSQESRRIPQTLFDTYNNHRAEAQAQQLFTSCATAMAATTSDAAAATPAGRTRSPMMADDNTAAAGAPALRPPTIYTTPATVERMAPVIAIIARSALYLSATQQGCIALMRMYEASAHHQKREMAAPLIRIVADLSCDSFGNYVVQCLVEHSEIHTAAQYVSTAFAGQCLRLACNKFASNVLEKVLRRLSHIPSVRRLLLDELVFGGTTNLQLACEDSYGNFVIQALVESCHNPAEFKKMQDRIRGVVGTSAYAAKIEAKLRTKSFQLSASSPSAISSGEAVSHHRVNNNNNHQQQQFTGQQQHYSHHNNNSNNNTHQGPVYASTKHHAGQQQLPVADSAAMFVGAAKRSNENDASKNTSNNNKENAAVNTKEAAARLAEETRRLLQSDKAPATFTPYSRPAGTNGQPQQALPPRGALQDRSTCQDNAHNTTAGNAGRNAKQQHNNNNSQHKAPHQGHRAAMDENAAASPSPRNAQAHHHNNKKGSQQRAGGAESHSAERENQHPSAGASHSSGHHRRGGQRRHHHIEA